MTQVSVVIPSYNHERFLAEAIDSVLQCSVDLELIVVDDGSTDRSREILEGYAADPRMRIYLQTNAGAHAALNRGLQEARGEFIFLLNSDDRFVAGRIEQFLERFAAAPELLTLTSWIRLIDGSGATLGIKEADRNLAPWPPRVAKGRFQSLENPRLSLLETNYISTTSNLAFRRSLLEQPGIEFPALRYTHDWYFALAAATAGPLSIVPEPLIEYRIHDTNTIKEGAAGLDSEGRDRGEARMHFEILWTLASHSVALREAVAAEGALAIPDPPELARRQRNSLPPFIDPARFSQLVHWRGRRPLPPPSYRALLDPRNASFEALFDSSRGSDRDPSPPEASVPDLSIVIPTRDRWETLQQTLEDLRREVASLTESQRTCEVIVVDDGSTSPPPLLLCDGTANVYPELDLHWERRPPLGPAAARNWGIGRAKAPRILLLGDDTPPRPGGLEAHLDPEIRAFGLQGRIDWDPAAEITPLMAFLAPSGPQFYFDGLQPGEVIPYTAVLGSNLSAPTAWFRQEPFDEGFPHASFEDTELAYRWHRRGWLTLFSETAGAWHRHNYSDLAPFLERQARAGRAARYAVGRHFGMLWTVALAPAIVTFFRSIRGPHTRENRWDLACRRAFLRSFFRPKAAMRDQPAKIS